MKKSEIFTAKAQAFLELMADLSDLRTQGEKAEAVGITYQHASRLRHTPKFAEALIARTREYVNSELPAIYAAMCAKARAGDVQAARTVFQASGEIQSGMSVVTNVTQTTVTDDDREKRIAALREAAGANRLVTHKG